MTEPRGPYIAHLDAPSPAPKPDSYEQEKKDREEMEAKLRKMPPQRRNRLIRYWYSLFVKDISTQEDYGD